MTSSRHSQDSHVVHDSHDLQLSDLLLNDHAGHSTRPVSPQPAKAGFSEDLSTRFDRQGQTHDLFRKQVFRWLVTTVLILLVILSLIVYEQKGNFGSSEKATFNLIQTVLNLGLGLNFFDAFKDLAKVLRWWILARKRHDIREVDLILGIENLKNVSVLGWEYRRKRWTLILCILWLLLNFFAQTSVAVIGLTYNLSDGTDWNGTYTQHGVGKAANLSWYFGADGGGEPRNMPEDYQATAHAYGDLSQSTSCGPYNDISDVEQSKYDYGYYCRRTPDRQEFSYRFSQYNPNDLQRIYPFFTNRIITASAGQCFAYDEVRLTNTTDVSGNTAWNYEYTNGTVNGSIIVPQKSGGIAGTTYIYRGLDVPQKATTFACGPRCVWMWAHKNPGEGENSVFYQCPITVTTVSNAITNTQTISDDVARLVASSIGLSGLPAWSYGSERKWMQYQFYPFGTQWELHQHNTDHVGANMAEFAIGSLSTMASRNPSIDVDGLVPHLGSSLTVYWRYLITLLAFIFGIHFLLFASAIVAARFVVITEDSPLSTAQLLRSLVEVMGTSGTTIGSKQLSASIQRRYPNGVVYGPGAVKDSNIYALDIGRDIQPRQNASGTYV